MHLNHAVSARSIAGLNWLNLMVALMQSGFGAFLSVYLTLSGWGLDDIGVALSVATIAAVVAQLPGGMLVDAAPVKRQVAGAAIVIVVLAALGIAAWPSRIPVLAAQIAQGAANSVLGPAIAAITLALTHTSGLGERLGHNVRFGALGAVAGAATMGAATTLGVSDNGYLPYAPLLLAAAAGIGALVALSAIHGSDMWKAPTRTAHRGAAPKAIRPPQDPGMSVACDRCLLTFALILFLFQLGNAALLPIAVGNITTGNITAGNSAAGTGPGIGTGLIVTAAVVVPQLIAAFLAPKIGQLAEFHGRRIILLAGLGAMAVRALLFAADGGSWLLVTYQALDGVTAAVLGVLIPLIVADITHQRGRFNLAMGVVGLASGLGAAISTSLAGAIAEREGVSVAFLVLALPGLAACLLTWTMPDTQERVIGPELVTPSAR